MKKVTQPTKAEIILREQEHGECIASRWGNCHCRPVCRICGNRKHTAVHMPALNSTDGAPFDQDFEE